MSYCNNCGRTSHCGEILSENAEDGLTGETYEWEVCKYCRCEKCTKGNNE
jgi:hypothetical protein|tara:strand:+ start:736 stop:885 length:150 start_codon:yes stop_codon:yes gene_type:complete